ncbi:MAG: hypothetical protein ACTSUR_06545 [Candidatus Heimdallarchaeaceae archaeon]
MSFRALYKISKRVYREGILHSQLEAAGSNQAKLLERIERDKMSRMPDQILKFISGIYIGVLTLIPIQSFLNIILSINQGVEISWVLFVGSLSLGAFFLLQPIILVVFSLMLTWGLMSGGPYQWLHTLPLKRYDIQKIGLFAFFRSINIQLIVMTFVFPTSVVISLIMNSALHFSLTKMFLLVVLSIIVSLANSVFNLSVVVIVGRKMAILIEEREENSKKSNIIRIGSMVLYFIISSTIMYLIQIAISKIAEFYQYTPINIDVTMTLNSIFSLLVFPLSPGYLATLMFIGFSKDLLLPLVGSILGLFAYFLLCFFMVKKALQALKYISSSEFKKETGDHKKTKLEDVSVEVVKPVKAFLKRDLAIVTREMGAMMILIMPLLIPIYAAITSPYEINVLNSSGLTDTFIILMSYALFTIYATIAGITTLESSGETITASLPIVVRDQVRAKLPFFTFTVPLALVLSTLFFLHSQYFMKLLIFSIVFLPTIPILGISGLFLKSILFGKMKYKVVLEEIKNKGKLLKYALVFLFIVAILSVLILSTYVGLWLTAVEELALIILLFIVFNFLFPKK